MQSGQAESGSQGQDLPGDDLTMSSETSSSTSTSSLTPEASESQRESGRSFARTHTIKDGSLVLSSSSPKQASSSTSPKPDEDPEELQEFTLTLHMSTYGREKHVHSLVASMLSETRTQGHHVHAAYLNDVDVTEDYKDSKGRPWYDPKFNGYHPEIED